MVKRFKYKFTLCDCLFGDVKLTKNTDTDKHGYSGYGTGFNASSQFLLPSGEWGKNVVIFSVDNSLSLYADDRKKDILVLAE